MSFTVQWGSGDRSGHATFDEALVAFREMEAKDPSVRVYGPGAEDAEDGWSDGLTDEQKEAVYGF